MKDYPPTVVWRHRKENLKKCSLRGLEQRQDFCFYPYPGNLPILSDYVILTLDAPPLSTANVANGLFIIDATWKYAEKMAKQIKQPGLIYRSLPATYRTAYPRRQEDCEDPERGLASIEAIYVAHSILGRDVDGLFDNYYWKESFIKQNFS